MNKRKIFLTVLLIVGISLLISSLVNIDFNNMVRESYLSLISSSLIIITAVIGFFEKFEWK